MSAFGSPHEIARETLRRMATRREPPTPGNYRKTYTEVSGKAAGDDASADPGWTVLLRTLTQQLDLDHQGSTPAQKRQALLKLLEPATEDSPPAKTYEALSRLSRQWSRLPLAAEAAPRNALTPAATATTTVQPETLEMLTALFAQALERGVAAQLSGAPELAAELRAIAGDLRAARDHAAITALAAPLKQVWYKLSLHSDDEDLQCQGLVRVLRLLIDNIQEITTDDQWLSGQMDAVKNLLAGPLSAQALTQVEASLRETMVRQGVLRHSLIDAKNRLKDMAGAFIQRIGELAAATGDYHDKIDLFAGKLRQTEDIGELGTLLDDIMLETRQIQSRALQSRDTLADARQQVEAAEQRIRQLEAELAEAGEKVREDQLTGALNRRGMDEAFDREIAIRQRNSRPLSVALLDIDNFKVLNDTHGHQAGDSALVHLAKLIRDTIRPTDTVARYGGEEFLILLPDSSVEESAIVIKRLQRQLTKHFFLHDNQNLLITFSAGVTGHAPDETQQQVIARADKALYQAKAAGKNRVVTA